MPLINVINLFLDVGASLSFNCPLPSILSALPSSKVPVTCNRHNSSLVFDIFQSFRLPFKNIHQTPQKINDYSLVSQLLLNVPIHSP